MRRVIVKLEEWACFLLIFFGLIVCMCETKNLDKQLITLGIGAGMMVAGVAICFLAKGEEDGYIR